MLRVYVLRTGYQGTRSSCHDPAERCYYAMFADAPLKNGTELSATTLLITVASSCPMAVRLRRLPATTLTDNAIACSPLRESDGGS